MVTTITTVYISFLVLELLAILLSIFMTAQALAQAIKSRVRTFGALLCLPRAVVIELAQRSTRVNTGDEDEDEDDGDEGTAPPGFFS